MAKWAMESYARSVLWRQNREAVRSIVQGHHERRTVRVDEDLSEWFITISGVMQGCVLSPLLFNILLEVVIALALENNEFGAKVSGFCIM